MSVNKSNSDRTSNHVNILFNVGGSSNPSFMPEDYASSSASCGVERIDIKRNFKRPINIAVYGHPFHEVRRKIKYSNDSMG